MASPGITPFDQAVLTPEFRNDPYPAYRALRESTPVYWCETWGCWVLTRYEDVVSVLQAHEQFSNKGRVTNTIEREYPGEFLGKIQPMLSHFSQGLINVDPPSHTRLRKLVQKTFLPKTLETLRPRIERLVGELLDSLGTSAPIDIVQSFASPLPVQVIAEMLGVPAAMRAKFKKWSHDVLEFQAVPRAGQETILSSQAALLEIREYLRELTDLRRSEPAGDLLSDLVKVEEEGSKLTQEELLSTGVSLLVAGHETTTNLISSALYHLLKNPHQLDQVRRNPELIPGAVEEILRFESPLQRLGRTVITDCEVGRQQLKQGQTVFALLGAANRDPDQFELPETLDISRKENRHIAFGTGIHFCLGAALARLEAPIALQALFERYPNLSLSTDRLEWNNGVMRGLRALPVFR